MQYIAHIDQDRIQSVKEHLEGTAKISGEFAGKFGKQDWGYCNGILHDIGKYSSAFQEKLMTGSNKKWTIQLPVQKYALKRAECINL